MTLAEDIKPRLKEILVDRLKLDRAAESIGDAEPLFGPEGLGLDSIDALELVIGVEQEFGVRIENEEVGTEALASIEKLAAFIGGKRAGVATS